MASSLDQVRRAVTVFLAGGQYMPLWQAVMDATEVVDADPRLTEAERDWFDELYDAVYMGAEDPVDPRSAQDGVIGASELRAHLREAGLDSFGAPPA